MSAPNVSRVQSRDGIEWHCERRGNGPDIIMIPSGEGDCESFAVVASTLASSFSVTTFDMPGMSRSTAPEAAMEDLTASKLAAQIVGLMDALKIEKTTVWGCSSGGLAALALAADHPDRVRNVIVHEVPLVNPGIPLRDKSATEIVETCRQMFHRGSSEEQAEWDALGPVYWGRLEKNYVTWARTYLDRVERSFSNEELRKRPVNWTIGTLTPAGLFWQNLVDGAKAGCTMGVLPSMHFPQVTIPDMMAEHIMSATNKHLTAVN